MNPNHQIDYPPASWVPPKILRTIKSCLQYETKLRPSIDQLIAEYETAFENVLKWIIIIISTKCELIVNVLWSRIMQSIIIYVILLFFYFHK